MMAAFFFSSDARHVRSISSDPVDFEEKCSCCLVLKQRLQFAYLF